MLNIQVLALTLIPLLSGVAPNEGSMPGSPLSILGIEERIGSEFMVGTWKCSDDFVRWGVTDRKRARAKVSRFRGNCLMTLHTDGTMKMVNLFRPSEGRWEMTDRGLVLYDPRYPERGSQVLPIRKRDENRIWLLLPFTHGSTGIGMVRVTDNAFGVDESRSRGTQVRRSRRLPSSPVSSRRVPLSPDADHIRFSSPPSSVSVEDSPLPATVNKF